ncbi:hypothetical protein KP509_07G041100 [Ceratopteris richardii]|nr:hypothetical protein KP509_07G041100 [Ceratopteris richardii]
MQFDIPTLRATAETAVRTMYFNEREGSPLPELPCKAPPSSLPEDMVLRWLYSHMSEQLRKIMQELYFKAKALNKKMSSE